MPKTCKPAITTCRLLPLLGVLLLAGAASGMPCKGEVTIGDTLAMVAENCGSATLSDHRALWVEEVGKKGSRRSTVIDEWTYDPGAEQLMTSYIFQNGKLSEIRSLGYGRLRDPREAACRNGESLSVGDSMVDAYLKCGEPLAKEKREDKIVETQEGEQVWRSSVAVAEWTYRYGQGVPGYTLRFENGEAAEIRTREFGK